MTSVRSRSETVLEAGALSAVGGFLDAYAFIAHGGVFANAQTGNIVLLAVDAAARQWAGALRHVLPICAFLAGCATVEVLARCPRVGMLRYPARLVLLIEALTFTLVGTVDLPELAGTILIVWAATLQAATFRQVRASAYATTFASGNLRALIADTAAAVADHDTAAAHRARALGAVVGLFAVGTVLGALATAWLHQQAIILVVPTLVVLLGSLTIHTTRLRRC